MRSSVRTPVRVVSALGAAAALFGSPVVLIRTVGVPAPTRDQWSMVWTDHQVDSAFVVRIGLLIVSVLWAWFAFTASAELVRVFGQRLRSGSGDRATTVVPPTAGGPSHWIKRWMRFIAVSSVVATGSVVVIAGAVGHPAERPPSVVAEVTVPDATPARGPSSGSAMAELAGLSLLAAGTVLAVQRARQRRLRTAPRSARVAPPSVDLARFELMLRSFTPLERIARLDHALRSAGDALDGSGASIVAARLAPDGTIRLLTSAPVAAVDPRWLVDTAAGEWTLPGSMDPGRSGAGRADRTSPNPLMVPVGLDTDGNECFIDVGSVGVLVVDSAVSDRILRSMAATVAMSPFMDHGTVITVGLDALPGDRSVEGHASVDTAVERARAVTDEPVIVFATGVEGRGDCLVAALLTPEPTRRSPIGVVMDGGASPYRLVAEGGHHVLQPWGWIVDPPLASRDVLEAVQSVLAEADRLPERFAPVVAIDAPPIAHFVEPEWKLLVRLLGQVEVVSAEGLSVAFDRSKALELVVWLALHRERPTRSKARAALWDTAVTAATFSNVVSEARRAMARVLPPARDSEWIARTLTDEMSLHSLVVSDADLLAARVDAARRLPSFDAIEVLRPGLELVAGLPFESSGYMWPDAEGHTSALVLLATDAASELAGHYLALGDIDGVFWATGQGLKVLSGHEELIAMRMRAHAARGDRSGVRHEWESYERALAADPWSAADPSPKLVALRAELFRSDARPTNTRAASA